MPRVIEPDWPAPANVLALCTTRQGGHSAAPYDSFNLAHHVGDSQTAVQANRAMLLDALPTGAEIAWLEQVHGTAVVEAQPGAPVPAADAHWSRKLGVACAVMTADCLPVLLCTTAGDVVAGAHAGWRGLLDGVLENTVAAMQSPAESVLAWFGPAIGPDAFEVGPEVRAAFLGMAASGDARRVAACFRPSVARPDHWFADLYALARVRLAALGVARVYGGEYCTHRDENQFFSYRRDGQTGRMASLILLR